MIKYLKEKWNLKSNFQLVIIFIVFAITGSSSLYISKPLMEFLSISSEKMDIFLYWILRFIIVTVVYQFVLLLVAFVFGQFNWFWNFEKKILKKMGLIK